MRANGVYKVVVVVSELFGLGGGLKEGCKHRMRGLGSGGCLAQQAYSRRRDGRLPNRLSAVAAAAAAVAGLHSVVVAGAAPAAAAVAFPEPGVDQPSCRPPPPAYNHPHWRQPEFPAPVSPMVAVVAEVGCFPGTPMHT